jgi:hypothetical protein
MSFLNDIKRGIQQRTLKKQLSKKDRKTESMNMAKATLIGLVFDATNLSERNTVLTYADQLKKKGKQIRLLGYFEQTPQEDSFSFKHYTKKDINWKGIPSGQSIKEFLDKKLDLFIHLNLATNLHSESIAALSDASLKIGPVTENVHCYDLMIDPAKNQNLNDFIKQVEALLQKTNTEHEPTNV